MERLKKQGFYFLLALLALGVQQPAAGVDHDYEEKTWSEAEVQLPAFPEKENLVQFKVGAISGTSFFIDFNSLSVAADEVIRYSLVAVSSSGAKNVSYEGMRCATGERKLYAFGRADGTWSKSKSDQWTRIHGTSNNYQVELFTNYFCTAGTSPVRDVDEARRILKSGGRFSAR